MKAKEDVHRENEIMRKRKKSCVTRKRSRTLEEKRVSHRKRKKNIIAREKIHASQEIDVIHHKE